MCTYRYVYTSCHPVCFLNIIRRPPSPSERMCHFIRRLHLFFMEVNCMAQLCAELCLCNPERWPLITQRCTLWAHQHQHSLNHPTELQIFISHAVCIFPSLSYFPCFCFNFLFVFSSLFALHLSRSSFFQICLSFLFFCSLPSHFQLLSCSTSSFRFPVPLLCLAKFHFVSLFVFSLLSFCYPPELSVRFSLVSSLYL